MLGSWSHSPWGPPWLKVHPENVFNLQCLVLFLFTPHSTTDHWFGFILVWFYVTVFCETDNLHLNIEPDCGVVIIFGLICGFSEPVGQLKKLIGINMNFGESDKSSKCIFYFTTSICSIKISWKRSLPFICNAEGQMKSCCDIFLDKCRKIIKQSYKSIFVFLGRTEKKWGLYNGEERLTVICIYRVCSTPASNKPLIPSHSLFLFAYDGKISSCPSNPKHLSQPMKESICF